MVVNGVPPIRGAPLRTTVTETPSLTLPPSSRLGPPVSTAITLDDGGQRCKGSVQNVKIHNMGELPATTRLQLVNGLQNFMQRRCPEVVQHLALNRNSLHHMVDVVKQQADMKFFPVDASSTNGNGASNSAVIADGDEKQQQQNRIYFPSHASKATTTRKYATVAGKRLLPLGPRPNSGLIQSSVVIFDNTNNKSNKRSAAAGSNTTINSSQQNCAVVQRVNIKDSSRSSSIIRIHPSAAAVTTTTAMLKIAPPVLSVATTISSSPTRIALSPKSILAPSTNSTTAATAATATTVARQPDASKMLILPTTIAEKPTTTTDNKVTKTESKANDEFTNTPKQITSSALKSISSSSSNAGKRVKIDPQLITTQQTHATSTTETPPPVLTRAPTSTADETCNTNAHRHSPQSSSSSSPTELCLQQRLQRTGISYTRLRTTSGNRSRRGGRSQQRWKSGTIVTHYLALSERDLADYPDRSPLCDNLCVETTVKKAECNRMQPISIGDYDEIPDEEDMDLVLPPPPPTTSSSPSTTTSTYTAATAAAAAVAEAYADDADDNDPRNYDVDMILSPATSTALNSCLPRDAVLVRLLQRRYSKDIKHLPPAFRAGRYAGAYQLTDEEEAIVHKNKYPSAITQLPEGTALVHTNMLRLIRKYFPEFNYRKYLGVCELCKHSGFVGFWPASKRFCSSQCTKRFSRFCQTQQNRNATGTTEQQSESRRVSAGHNISSSTQNSRDTSRHQRGSRGASTKHSQSTTALAATTTTTPVQPRHQQQHQRALQPPVSPIRSHLNNSGGGGGAPAVESPPQQETFPVKSQVLLGLEHKPVKDWTKEEVAQYIAGFVFHVSAEIPQRFIDDCIDGQALMLLDTAILTTSMSIPLGHALKINYAIDELRKTGGFVDIKKLRIPS